MPNETLFHRIHLILDMDIFVLQQKHLHAIGDTNTIAMLFVNHLVSILPFFRYYSMYGVRPW
jgi:hypothetical protein